MLAFTNSDSTERTKTKMERRGSEKRGKKRKKKRERMAVRELHWPFYPPQHATLYIVAGSFEAQKPLREFKGSFLIKYSFCVKLAWHHCQPLTTGPSLHSYTKFKKDTETCTHSTQHSHHMHWPTHTARSHLEVVDKPGIVELSLFSVDRFWVDADLSVSLCVYLSPEKIANLKCVCVQRSVKVFDNRRM